MSTRNAGSSTTYRPDIDGLRALAVLLVVLYHLRTAKCVGGYIGVDVFFVISGYLIGSHVFDEVHQGQFSLASFYERRIRRILPALVVVLTGSFLLGLVYLTPSELIELAESLLAALFSSSNIYFARRVGYFDNGTVTNPLLHTWSLAVEEQFYLVFPLLVVLLNRVFRKKLPFVILALAAASLGLSAVGAFTDKSDTFYLAHTRAWELLLGTLLAMRMIPHRLGPVMTNVTSLAGIALILLAGFAYSDATPFPGLAAVLPCLGAALVIFAGQDGVRSSVGGMLSIRPLVFVGLISFSLYLWHWPIIVFFSTYSEVGSALPPRTLKATIFLASLAAAAISWRFVETPIRYGRLKPSRKALFRGAGFAVVGSGLFAASALTFGGFPARWSTEAARVASFGGYNFDSMFRSGTCFVDGARPEERFDEAACLKEDSRRKNYLLLGDSHAADLWNGLQAAFEQTNIMQATFPGCKPVIEDEPERRFFDRLSDRQARCREMMKAAYTRYIPSLKVGSLIIAANWVSEDLQGLERSLEWARARGYGVVLIGPRPQYYSPLPRLLATAIQAGDPGVPSRHLVQGQAALDSEMAHLAKRSGAKYVSLQRIVCSGSQCVEFVPPRIPLQFDRSHFTSEGALWIGKMVKKTGGL